MATDQQHMSRAQRIRAQRQQGVPWTAPSGIEVMVRELDIADHAVIDIFPTDLQQIIYAIIERDARLSGPSDPDEEINPFAGLSGKEIIEREYEIGAALCKVGWVDPRVVDTVTDETTEISVDEVESRDRRAYMGYVFGTQQQEAQKLAAFPQQPARPVGPRSDQPAVLTTTKPGDGAVRSGVLSRDSV